MLAPQSELLVGSFVPVAEVGRLSGALVRVETSFTCVAGGPPVALKVRSVRSGATGRGLTDGNALSGECTILVQPAAIEPSSQVGFARLPAAHE